MKNNHHLDRHALQREQEMVLAAQNDHRKFSDLYDRYFEPIFRFIYRRTGRENLTADLCSQTFLKALQNLKKYQYRGVPFSAWLYKIASNEVNKYYRKTKKVMEFSLEESVMGEVLEEPDLLEDQIEHLERYLDNLSTEEVMILELRFYENRSFQEISYILGISESAAKMRTYRAIEKLKKYFVTTKTGS